MRRVSSLVVVVLGLLPGGTCAPIVSAQAEQAAVAPEPTSLRDAQAHFYNARYQDAAAVTLALRAQGTQELANYELRTSALLFQLKALLEDPASKEGRKKEALKSCATCPDLMAAFFADIRDGQAVARSMLRANPADETALFFLGKLDLNYVWLQLGPLGRKTGWDEYWEARRSLDAVIKAHPRHVRALVARAWIDYIVDTKMPWGTKWLLGGGNRKRAVTALQEAARIDAEYFIHTEAQFALWEIQVRERQMTQATEVARHLAQQFPDNREVAAFLEGREASARR